MFKQLKYEMIMKKVVLLILLLLLAVTNALAGVVYPIVREGVKWVNEKVIINQGDTTCYYYNYEISGMDSTLTNMLGDINHACYFFTSDQLNVERDSLIAGLDQRGYEVTCYRNDAYVDAVERDRPLFWLNMYTDGGTRILYDFGCSTHDGVLYEGIRYYFIGLQWYWTELTGEEGVLTEENLVMADSINIEGFTCARCAYIGEQGDTLAYVVEGIGFDSRDMGDLLTPFMRPPDPTADYQEYCGLSHVVKDGKIIYKGMRYREGAFDAINEVVADRTQRPTDPHYYNLMGQPVGTEVPTAPGIYIHQGKKICVGRLP